MSTTQITEAFDYVATDEAGKRRRGTIDAPSKAAALARVRAQGLTPVSVTESSFLTRDLGFSGLQRRIPLRQVTLVIRQLATMLDAGLTLVRGLNIITAQVDDEKLREVLKGVLKEIERGHPLSDAFAKRPDVFPPLLVHLVRAGEAGGFLSQSLESAAEGFEADLKIRDTMKSAMTYPVIVLCIAVLAVFAMLTFIVPVFEGMYSDLGGDLPIPTQVMVVLSNNMVWVLPIVLVAALAAWLWFRRYGAQAEVRVAIDRARSRIPVLGSFFRKAAIARFTRTLATTIGAGVPILQALSIVKQSADSALVEEAVGRVADGVRKGRSLAALLAGEEVFPPLVTQMVAVGEDTGALDAMLQRVAEFTDREVQLTAERLTAMIEPIMVVVVGVIVGGMILAMYLPMFGIFDQMNSM